MLKLQDITIQRGGKTLISHIQLDIFEKMIIGIVGANGCGKTSLFSAIRGALDVSHGEMDIKRNLAMSWMDQEVPGLEISALDYAISGDPQLFQTLQKLQEAEATQDYEAIMHCHTELAEQDGYSAEARAGKILAGLEFSETEQRAPVKSFSGGWRMRLSLARCLFAPSELMLLDEPTNHLDLETIVWLENYLKRYSGAILLISHDRDFLDQVATHIAHIENQTLKLYTGNYSNFEVQRAQQIAIQNAQFKKQQIHIAHLTSFVDRFRAKATKAKQAQSRLKALEKMELVAPIHESSPFKFTFLKPDRMPNPMLTVRKADFGYDDKIVLKNVTMQIRAGERIGLLGVNGAGKSTLIKAICGDLKPQKGGIDRSAGIVIGYFAQHQVDYLPTDISPLELLKRSRQNQTEKELIAYLASFNFNRDQLLSPMERFSGGEKARIALAMIIWQKPNLLLMDEPTNHLDLEMREALSLALQNYEGSMILVSHDRYLLRLLVDELYLIKNGQVSQYDGSVESYQNA
ncbi:MAG: ATP-binding cassette domain-containing protein [Gammaproteobacteria bacterium]